MEKEERNLLSMAFFLPGLLAVVLGGLFYYGMESKLLLFPIVFGLILIIIAGGLRTTIVPTR